MKSLKDDFAYMIGDNCVIFYFDPSYNPVDYVTMMKYINPSAPDEDKTMSTNISYIHILMSGINEEYIDKYMQKYFASIGALHTFLDTVHKNVITYYDGNEPKIFMHFINNDALSFYKKFHAASIEGYYNPVVGMHTLSEKCNNSEYKHHKFSYKTIPFTNALGYDRSILKWDLPNIEDNEDK